MRKWLVILGVGALSLWGLDSLLPRDGPPGLVAPGAPIASQAPRDAPVPDAHLAPGDAPPSLAAKLAPIDSIVREAEAACSGECVCLGTSERVWRAARSRPLRSAVAAKASGGGPAVGAVARGDRADGAGDAAAAANVTVRGEVVDRAGRPVAGAQVMLLDGGGGRLDASSDADGQFQFAVPRGDYVAVARGEGLLPGHASIVAGAPVQLVLEAPGTLAGRVLRGEDSSAAARAVIELAADGCRRRLEASEEGLFEFDGLTPGRYELSARLGERRVQQTVQIGRGAAAHGAVELRLDER